MCALGGSPPVADGTDRQPFRLGHRPGLDGIRGVAIMMVMAVHATYLLVPRYMGLYVPGAFCSVNLFFVLSGFLISSLLIEERDATGHISFRRFYQRRALRLFPTLYVMLIAQLVYALVEGFPIGQELSGLAAIVAYVFNWLLVANVTIPFGVGQVWSLAVEEQFYLLWPLLLTLTLRRSTASVIRLCLVAVVIGFGSRLALALAGVGDVQIYVQTEGRFDGFAMGALLAIALHRGWRVPRWVSLLVGPAVALLALVTISAHTDSRWVYEGGDTLFDVAALVVVWAAIDRRRLLTRVLSVRPLTFIGDLSYDLYLWHVLYFEALYRWAPGRPAWELLGAGLALAFGSALVTRQLVELPLLKRRGPRYRAPVRPAGGPSA